MLEEALLAHELIAAIANELVRILMMDAQAKVHVRVGAVRLWLLVDVGKENYLKYFMAYFSRNGLCLVPIEHLHIAVRLNAVLANVAAAMHAIRYGWLAALTRSTNAVALICLGAVCLAESHKIEEHAVDEPHIVSDMAFL